MALAESPGGIPPEGAIALLQHDPLTQGPRVFRTYCADCHQPASMQGQFRMPPQAPELADLTDPEKITFGDRAWIKSVLTNFSGHFAPLANIKAEEGATP